MEYSVNELILAAEVRKLAAALMSASEPPEFRENRDWEGLKKWKASMSLDDFVPAAMHKLTGTAERVRESIDIKS